jgi:molybdopterin/thiamine biosynthesis adenylyltransferase
VKGAYYQALRTNRNNGLVDPALQEKLYGLKVGLFGLSVGSNILQALNMSSIGSEFVIADLDRLETHNLNRLQAEVGDIGDNKAVIAARRAYLLNPFLKIKTLTGGIGSKTLEKILQNDELDIIIDEVDNLSVKLDIRELARKYKVPVLMITDNGDGVVLHVERFDLGYTKIFGQSSREFWEKRLAQAKGPKEISSIIIDLIGGRSRVDKNMLKAIDMVIDGKINSWPQLGVAAMVGGAVATVALKKIFSGVDKRRSVIDHFII